MTKTVNWKKQKIERFRNENIDSDGNSNGSSLESSENKNVLNGYDSQKNEEAVVLKDEYPLPSGGTSLVINGSYLCEEKSEFLQRDTFVSTRIIHPDSYITSSTDNGNFVLPSNVSFDSYNEPKKEEIGSEELKKLQNLKDIVISTVSSSDLPQEHTRHSSSEPNLGLSCHMPQLSQGLNQNLVQSNITSSCTYTSESSIKTAMTIKDNYVSDEVSPIRNVPAVNKISTNRTCKQTSTKKGKGKTSTRAPRKR